MALTKVVYTDNVTVIYAQNLNDIQDAIIALEQSGFLPLTGGTMTGAIAMGGYKITGLGAGSANTDAVTKKQLDDAISGIGTVFNIKGDVAAVSDLPPTGNSVGDVYYVQSVSAAYVWLETTAYPNGYWEEFGEPIDLSGYIEKPSSASANQFLMFNGSAWIAGNAPLPKTTTLTIATTDWSSLSCTKTVTGMTTTAVVWLEYSDTTTEFTCTQGTDALTFGCNATPSAAVTVKVAFMEGVSL